MNINNKNKNNRADGISRLWEKGGPFAGAVAPRRIPGYGLCRFFEDSDSPAPDTASARDAPGTRSEIELALDEFEEGECGEFGAEQFHIPAADEIGVIAREPCAECAPKSTGVESIRDGRGGGEVDTGLTSVAPSAARGGIAGERSPA